MKTFDERSRDDKISLLRKLIAYEGRHSLTTPVRYGLSHPASAPGALPFETRQTVVTVPIPGGRHLSIPAVVADRRTALKTMEAMLKELEAGDAQG